MKYSTKDSHIPFVEGMGKKKRNNTLGSIMIISISVALEIHKKDQMLEDLFSQST